jgi:hypothetical protein
MTEKLTERQARIKALEVAQGQIDRSIESYERAVESHERDGLKVDASNARKVARHLRGIEQGIRQKLINNRHAESKAQGA